MKQLKIYAMLFTLTFLMFGCENTYENLVGERGANVTAVISNLKPAIFNEDLANSFISFTVSLPEGEVVDAAEVEVSLGDKSAILTSLATFPATVTIKAIDAINALGVDANTVTTSSVFYISVLTEKNGQKTRSKTSSLKVPVVCAFDPTLAVGSYDVVSADWEVQGDVTLVADANDPYKIRIKGLQAVDGLTGSGLDVIVDIDPGTFAVTGGTTLMAADLSEWDLAYTNYSYKLKSGSYNSCEGSFVLNFDIFVDQGAFGTFKFTFTKK